MVIDTTTAPVRTSTRGPATPAAPASTETAGARALAAAQAQYDAAAEYLNLEPGLREVLRVPQRELSVKFPVKLDDGSVKVFSYPRTTTYASPPATPA